jgi:membrane protease YdiL (CAAX protease family)
LRARNDTAALVATVFLVLTVLAMIGALVLRVRDHDVPWRIVLGFGVVALVLQLLTALNQFDLEKFGYRTQDGYASFVTQFLLQAVLGALGGGGLIVLFTAAAEPVYRERHPQHLALSSYFTWRGLRTKSFFKQLVLGLALMFFFAAYQAVFYLVAARFGAWAPLEVPFSNLLNTAIPWAVVLFIGFFPAVSEEFLSRMFSLPFLAKHLPRVGLRGNAATAAAVVLASFVWGFAHSNYPNQPYWIRGVEVGLAGVLVSIVMLRWGIFATLVWHYTVDAFYTSLLMLRSGNPYFVVSGSVTAGIMLVPLAAALILYWRRRGFEPAAGLRNADLPGPRPAAPHLEADAADLHVHAPFVPASRRALWGGAAIGAALLLLFFVPVERPGDGIRLETDRSTALAAGRAHLQALGTDPARWRTAVQIAERYEEQVGRYVLEHADVPRLNDLYTTHLRTPVWRLRYFRADEREEWLLNLPIAAPTATGLVPELWAFEHIEPDTASGATLSMEAAQARAGEFMRARGVDPARLDLKESRAESQPSRTDYSFEWEVPDTTLGDAGVRYLVRLHGDEPAGVRPYLHLPEAWVRAFESKSVLQRVLWFASRAVFGLLAFALVAVFVQQVKLRRFRWRAGVAWGVVAGLLSAILTALRWQSDVLFSYTTTMPYQLFMTGATLSLVLQFVLTTAMVAVLAGTALAVRPQSATIFAGGHDRRTLRQGVLLALVAVVLQVGVARFEIVLASLAPRFAVPAELVALPAAARPLPWLDLFAGLVRYLIVVLAVIVILLHAAQRFLGLRRTLVLMLAAALLFAADGAHSLGEFALQACMSIAGAATAAFVALGLLRGNELAWVLALLLGRGVATVPAWLPHPAVRTAGIVLGVLVLATAGAVYALAARRSDAARRTAGATG